jgi:thymidylate synthase (FAD)
MKTADISVEYIQHTGSDLAVVNAARVSFDKESAWEKNGKFSGTDNNLPEKDEKLIRYLANHKHFSPFNHSFITLRIKAPVFVARQLVKHKFMPWNEVSRRYVDDEPEFYFPDVWRAKAENVKQGSSEQEVDINPKFMTYASVGESLKEYNRMISLGVCAEQARMILPQNMMTSWWWSGTLGAYCDMLKLRLDPHTQKESRIVAEKVKEIIEPLFPVSVPALLGVK